MDVECALEPEGCFPTFWIWQESNGLDGLQRHDFRVDNTCGGAVAADDELEWHDPLAELEETA